MENIVLERRLMLTPMKDINWADTMVLNPAIIKDPKTGRIHMLVRVSGPYEQKRIEGKPLPYPIFIAYAWSDDGGETFEYDWERPCLSPKIEYEKDKILIKNGRGEMIPDYTNGCIEDPRLFWVEGECYCSVACRMFPAGPYWDHDEPTQCSPDWVTTDENPYGTQKNQTVTSLYKVDLDALAKKDYENAFTYITYITPVTNGEDRDVFFFPKRMKIDGKDMLVMLHRPHHPDGFEGITETRPSIMMSAAEDFYSIADNAVKRKVLYAPTEWWQEEKVGGSTPPLPLGNGEWLFNYHGKQDNVNGYAQSFMILKEKENDFPEITHICKEKWIVDEADFEKPSGSKFKTPCVFFTGLIEHNDELLVSYGAADQNVGLMRLDYKKLMEELRKCKI